MKKNEIVSTFETICRNANDPAELVRNYIETFNDEIVDFGKQKCDCTSHNMNTLYNYIDGQFRRECEPIEYDFVDYMLKCAEVYCWHKALNVYRDDDERIVWVNKMLNM